MSIWNTLFSLGVNLIVESVSKPQRTSTRENRGSTDRSRVIGSYSPGDILQGKVDFVADKFVKVVAGNVTAIIFPSEMADGYVSNPAEILKAGQSTEFVLLSSDARGWKASIRAVPEARVRKALANVSEGERVKARVIELKDRGAVIDTGEFQAWVPVTELAWCWVDHPAEVVAIGEQVEVEITRIDTPDDWLMDRRKRKARAVASLRACIPEPMSPTLPVAFSGMPFKVWAVARIPRNFDAVARFVLEEIANGQSREAIAATTGLDQLTLQNIHSFLVEEQLADNWLPSERGRALVEAIALARELNEDPIRGLYASAAPPAAQLVSVDEHRAQRAYPRDWPRPPYDKHAEDQFTQAADEALPEALLEKLVTGSKRKKLAQLQEDDRLRVFLRRDGSRPWKVVVIDTPEHWLLAGLWRAFRPFVGSPYRPASKNGQCEGFILVRCRAVRVGQEESAPKMVYLEPNTETLWCLEEPRVVRIKDMKGGQFPVLPVLQVLSEGGAELAHGQTNWELQPDSWCSVKVLKA